MQLLISTTSLVCAIVASRTASRIPQTFTRVPGQKHHRAQRKSQSKWWTCVCPSEHLFPALSTQYFCMCSIPLCAVSDCAGPALGLSNQKVYGEPLLSHLSKHDREIAVPIEECIHMLLRTGMEEEVGLMGWKRSQAVASNTGLSCTDQIPLWWL